MVFWLVESCKLLLLVANSSFAVNVVTSLFNHFDLMTSMRYIMDIFPAQVCQSPAYLKINSKIAMQRKSYMYKLKQTVNIRILEFCRCGIPPKH